jgi:hypothetical protein
MHVGCGEIRLTMSKTLPKGHASCLAPGFKYTPSTHTDLAKTFARIKRRLKPKPNSEQGNVRQLHSKKSA